MIGLAFHRNWKHVTTKGWEVYMPAARPQYLAVLPREDVLPPIEWPRDDDMRTRWDGTCCVHAFYESITGRLRIWYEKVVNEADEAEGLWYDPSSFQVDLLAMLHCAAGRGLLRKSGASTYSITCLASSIGIPLSGFNLPFANLRPDPEEGHLVYAMGITFKTYTAVPLPAKMPTREKIEAAMRYREHLCACLDSGPIEASLHLQQHYFARRPADEPYRRLPDGIPIPNGGHAVCLYGYECPDGTVASLVLNYQENALRPHPDPVLASRHLPHPSKGPAARHIIHPDAIEWYSVPDVTNATISDTPGTTRIDYSPKPDPKSPWEDVLDGIRNMLS